MYDRPSLSILSPRSMRLSTIAPVVSCGKRHRDRSARPHTNRPDGKRCNCNLETAMVLVDGLNLLEFGRRRGCEIAFDLCVERRLVALDGEQVVGPGIEGRLSDGDLAPMASVETKAPVRSSRSIRAGIAVISLDFSNTAS
jgi:hypothetical protein